MNPSELYRDISDVDMRRSLDYAISSSKFHRKHDIRFGTPSLTDQEKRVRKIETNDNCDDFFQNILALLARANILINKAAAKGITIEQARRLAWDYFEEEDLSARCILQLGNNVDNWESLTTILFNFITTGNPNALKVICLPSNTAMANGTLSQRLIPDDTLVSQFARSRLGYSLTYFLNSIFLRGEPTSLHSLMPVWFLLTNSLTSYGTGVYVSSSPLSASNKTALPEINNERYDDHIKSVNLLRLELGNLLSVPEYVRNLLNITEISVQRAGTGERRPDEAALYDTFSTLGVRGQLHFAVSQLQERINVLKNFLESVKAGVVEKTNEFLEANKEEITNNEKKLAAIEEIEKREHEGYEAHDNFTHRLTHRLGYMYEFSCSFGDINHFADFDYQTVADILYNYLGLQKSRFTKYLERQPLNESKLALMPFSDAIKYRAVMKFYAEARKEFMSQNYNTAPFWYSRFGFPLLHQINFLQEQLIPLAVFRNLVNNEFYHFDPIAGTDAERHTLGHFFLSPAAVSRATRTATGGAAHVSESRRANEVMFANMMLQRAQLENIMNGTYSEETAAERIASTETLLNQILSRDEEVETGTWGVAPNVAELEAVEAEVTDTEVAAAPIQSSSATTTSSSATTSRVVELN